MIFVDTGGLYALHVRRDANHQTALAWSRQNVEPLVTSDFVVAEVLTLLQARRLQATTKAVSQILALGELVRIEWVTESDFHAAWRVFDEYADKLWSFTDCTSRIVMHRLGIQCAFAFDRHFQQFGTVTVVP